MFRCYSDDYTTSDGTCPCCGQQLPYERLERSHNDLAATMEEFKEEMKKVRVEEDEPKYGRPADQKVPGRPQVKRAFKETPWRR